MGVTLLVLALILGFYVSWNIGANDVANAMGTSVGSGALTLRRACVIAAIFEFSGAFLLGSHVVETVESGVIDPLSFAGEPYLFVYGMLAALLAVGVWLQVASYYGWPVSTTHTIIGALIGFGLVAAGFEAIQWSVILSIILSWIISPVIGGVVAFLVFTLIRHKIFYASDPVSAARKWVPFFVFLLFAILALAILFKGLEKRGFALTFWPSLGLSLLIGVAAAGVSLMLIHRFQVPPRPDEPGEGNAFLASLERALRHLTRAKARASQASQEQLHGLVKQVRSLFVSTKGRPTYQWLEGEFRIVEKLFTYLQILSAAFMAFAHGANDVANAIGPLAAALNVLRTGTIVVGVPVPLWVLTLGGVGIVIGLATWGWRVIQTVGKKITELTPTRGFAAEFGAAITIVIATCFGMPISTTHTLVGAVLGVGLARGIGALNLNVIRDIVISWAVTVPAGAILAMLFYELLKVIF